MKKVFFSVALATVMLTFSSCAWVGFFMGQEPDLTGMVFTSVTQPSEATSNKVGSKVGTAKVFNICNVVAIGDAGIDKAAKLAGISKVSHVDVKTTNILGLYIAKTYFVYGE